MARRTAAEKAAEEAVTAETERRNTDKQRLMWAGVFVAAVALFGVGYVIGQSDDDTLVAGDVASPLTQTTPRAGVAPGTGQGLGRGQGIGQGSAGIQAHSPGTGVASGIRQGQGQGRGGGGMGMADGMGMGGGGMGSGAGSGMGPGLGPDGSGLPAQGNIERVPGQGPYGQNFPGECPFGIYEVPEDGFDPSTLPTVGWLGVGVGQASQGVLVLDVSEGSPAGIAGVEIDDVVVRLGGTEVATVGQFARLVRVAGAGSEVELVLLRSGDELTVRVLLGSPPE